MTVDGAPPARAGTDGAGDGGRRAVASGGPVDGPADDGPREPCLRCGVPLALRQMGCRGGHCPNCGHPYPHGDCSD